MNCESTAHLFVSFHDLAPHSQETCKRFLSKMKELGISCVSLLVVPNWYRCEPIQQNEAFMQWLHKLQQEGHEIVLHGWCHQASVIQGSGWNQLVGRFYTAGEGEFYQMGYDEAKKLLMQGKEILQNYEIHSKGFVAPAWLLNHEAQRALRALGFTYTTYWGEIEYLPGEIKFPAPTVVASSRSAWRRWVSRRWCPLWQWRNRHASLLRIALHPFDLEYPEMETLLLELIRKAMHGRQILTYGEWITQWEATHE